MAEATETHYLSIGEVLGLLLEEFPDVTISKIRFLESQGLISPERTASGYRKFYDDDVELLRVILTEQRENYLPLRVIKDRLETGEIDPTGEHLRPNGVDKDVSGEIAAPAAPDLMAPAELATDAHARPDEVAAAEPGAAQSAAIESAGAKSAAAESGDVDSAEVPTTSIAAHPASRRRSAAASERGDTHVEAPLQLLPGVLLDRAELCAMVGMTDGELADLESFGIVAARDSGGTWLYDEDAVAIARPACEFLRAGVDARHLRAWRTAADREASLFEQLVTPRFRQRNPEARAEALTQLRRLDGLGAQLRAALTRHALRHHFDA